MNKTFFDSIIVWCVYISLTLYKSNKTKMVDYGKLYLAYEKEVEIKNKSKEIDIDPRELALSLPGMNYSLPNLCVFDHI